jgi:DNA-directed RNA polymerase specialized sigma subunit
VKTDTVRQYQTYRAAADFEDRIGRQPTIKELARELGISYAACQMRVRAYELDLPRDRPGRPRRSGGPR